MISDWNLKMEYFYREQFLRAPSISPETARLAILVEDHPLDYLHFEGMAQVIWYWYRNSSDTGNYPKQHLTE